MAAKLGIRSEGIETCMFCRRCEEACPSGVVFSKIMSSYRKPSLQEIGSYLLLEAPYLLYLAIKYGLSSKNELMKRLREYVGEISPPIEYSDNEAEVVLFPGCIMSVLFRSTVEKALKLLKSRYRVKVVNGCCGLAHYSGGYNERVLRLREKLRKDFEDKKVVVLSSNCAAYLKESGFNVYEFSEFLVKEKISLNSKKIEVTVHYSCHAHIMGLSRYLREALEILGVKIKEMEDPSFECGAGGDRFLFSPEISNMVLEEKSRKIEKSGAKVVISNNPVCSLMISKAGFKVMHLADVID
jgi:glycolate oxidase iron-sulfur subunit